MVLAKKPEGSAELLLTGVPAIQSAMKTFSLVRWYISYPETSSKTLSKNNFYTSCEIELERRFGKNRQTTPTPLSTNCKTLDMTLGAGYATRPDRQGI